MQSLSLRLLAPYLSLCLVQAVVGQAKTHLSDGTVAHGVPVVRARNGDLFFIKEPGKRPPRLRARATGPLIFDGERCWTVRADPRTGDRDLLLVDAEAVSVEALLIDWPRPIRLVASDGVFVYFRDERDGLRVRVDGGATLETMVDSGHLPGRPGWQVRGALAHPHRLVLAHDPGGNDGRGSLVLLRRDDSTKEWRSVVVGPSTRARIVASEKEVFISHGAVIDRFDATTLQRLGSFPEPPGRRVTLVGVDDTHVWAFGREREGSSILSRGRAAPDAPWVKEGVLVSGMASIGHGDGRIWAARLYRNGGQRLAWLDKEEALAADRPIKTRNPGKLQSARPLVGLSRGARTTAMVPAAVAILPFGIAFLAGEGPCGNGARGKAGGAEEPPEEPRNLADVEVGDWEVALAVLLDHERHAATHARAVLARRGIVRPFMDLRRSADDNARALSKIMEKRDFDIPPDPWFDHSPVLPATFAELCDEAADLERASLEVIETMLGWEPGRKVRDLLEEIQRVTSAHELPALVRCGSGA